MSDQGARARAAGYESRRVFAISKVRLNAAGKITDVLRAEINAKSNLDIATSVVVPVADVVDAIHDGARIAAVFPTRLGAMPDYAFEVIEFTNGAETIDLAALPEAGSHRPASLDDLARLDD